ncbi:protein kinase [Nocardia colli]|uniref:non-specific serine/threonine protein kinase n=1 Tax=Nocardia colli TaxID=2545717 RepID=A0A5N0E3Q5_9NOCA|nr:serine/threonine-protein kinase [Nocardia colli]KAA8882979.1 protein kinase [Nocardia colli]
MRPLGADDPTRIGDYRLLGVLGAGGMGRVYLGRNAGGRTVAVKVIRPDLVGDNEFRERFRREVTAARRVGGQFTAPVLDADVEADPPWLATGYVAGFSLTEAVGEYGPFAENSLLVLAHGLAEALVAVHAADLVHRDLKPSNVLLALDGPKVIDFGIARAIDDSQFTTTGKVIGSPGFMCPEQVTGDPVGPATDVFALGGVLVFAATGQGPFGIGDMVQMLWRVVYEEPRLDAVPDRLRPLIAACLTKDPAARPTPERIIADLTALGLPGRGGWLPGAALEEVSRRAVQLLDLDSGPFDVPDALSKQPNPTRTAETVVQPFTDPNARPVTDPNARPVTDPNARTATSMPGAGQPNVTPRSWWKGAPDPAGQQYSYGPQDGSNTPPHAQAAPQDRSYTPPHAHQYVAPQDGSYGTPYPQGGPYGTPHPQDGPYGASQPGAHPNRARRRIALIAGGLVLCLVVAIAAFVITKQFTDSNSSTDHSTASPGDPAAELPEAFVGEWKGAVEDKLATFDVVLTLNAGTVGDELGSSTNTGRVSGATCGRAETLTAADDEQLTLTARLTEDGGGCNDDGKTTHLQLLPDGTLSYRTASIIGDMSGILTKTS